MRGLVIAAAFALVVWTATPVQAAATFVQSTSCSGNDATCTFGAAPSASNLVIVMASVNALTNTLSITDWTHAEVTWLGPVDSSASRSYAFCTVGDGADTTMILTTSVNAAARTMAVEVTGAGNDCTEVTARDTEGTGVSEAVTTHALSGAMTVAAGSFMLCHVGGSTSANYTHTYTADATVAASDLEIGGEALGGYVAQAAGGSFDCTHTSVANEIAVTMGISVKASAGGGADPLIGLRGLLGVGK